MSVVEATRLSAAPDTARTMARAAIAFLADLDADQRGRVTFPFEGDERYHWHYTPIARKGLALKDMTDRQRGLAFDLVATGLSERGREEVQAIVALEEILQQWEEMRRGRARWVRDAELYFFAIFGDPRGAAPWAWKVGGHHIGLHFTVIAQELVACLPLFFGANPAEVQHGPHKGQRTLVAEQDMARELVQSLDAAQQRLAIVDATPPGDILTKNYRVADPAAPPRGIGYAGLHATQRARLSRLVRHYADRASAELGVNEWRKIEAEGVEAVTFAWAGPVEAGRGHYYAIAGPEFVIEYDNTQETGNHIHSVFRRYRGDWGEDLLAAHYADTSHRS